MYGKHPEKIQAIKQENRGAAEARNVAMEKAIGEYIMFVDSDDFVEKDYIENYIKQVEAEDYDLVLGGYHKSNDEKILYTVPLQDETWSMYMVMGPYARLYKRSFLQENGINFIKVNIGEDIYFNLQANALAKKVKILDYVGYHWYLNTSSISNTMHKDIKKVEIDKMLNASYDRLKEKKAITEENYPFLELYYFNFIIWVLQWTTQKTRFKDMSKAYDKLFEWLKERFPNYKKNKLIGITKPKGERLQVRVMFFVFMILHKMRFGKVLVYVFSRMR